MIHKPVLLKEALAFLDPKRGEIVLDATVDGGGHAKEIISKISPKGKFIGIDADADLLNEAKKNLMSSNNSKSGIFLLNGNFRDLDVLLAGLKIKKVDAALFDLGVSSYQLDSCGRGFSFLKNEPLIMNLKNPLSDGDLTAKQILNSWPEKEIYGILKEYGEERFASSISKGIIGYRKTRRFETTQDLAEAIENSVPNFYKRGKRHFATKTFQALRIAVNDELNALADGISKAWEVLNPGGRLAVISFHSLEDRIVKNFFRDKYKEKAGILLTKKPIVPSLSEIKDNPRSRSAKLRAILKNK